LQAGLLYRLQKRIKAEAPRLAAKTSPLVEAKVKAHKETNPVKPAKKHKNKELLFLCLMLKEGKGTRSKLCAINIMGTEKIILIANNSKTSAQTNCLK